MMEKSKMKLEEISIQSIRINYIYSFFLGAQLKNNDNEISKIILNWDSPSKNNSKTLKQLFKSELFQKEELDTDSIKIIPDLHESEEKEPLSNRSALYFKFPHISILKEYKKKVIIQGSFSENKEGTICTHIALFETGMGLMWLSVQIDDNIDPNEVNLLNKRKNIPILKFPDLGSRTLQDFYKNETEDLVGRLNVILRKHICTCEYYRESSCFWEDDNNDYLRGKGVYQEPSVAILVKSNNYLKYIQNNDFQNYVSSILHGIEIESLDQCHSKEHLGEYCTNLYPDKHFFTRLHGNSLLVFHDREYEKNNSAQSIEDYNCFKEFTYGLFRTYCAVRGTWYVYNLLSEEIDNNLKKLNQSIEKDISTINKAQETKQNIILKSHFLHFLNSEDPFVRGIGLTKFAKLHEEALEIYKPENIKENIKYKLNEYDKLIDAVNNYEFYSPLSLTTKKSKKSQVEIFIILSVACCIVVMFGLKYLLKYEIINGAFLIVFSIIYIISVFFFYRIKKIAF
jgi:hypothetical protein